MIRLPPAPSTGNPAIDQWMRQLILVLEPELNRLQNQASVPIFKSTALPPATMPNRTIMITTSTTTTGAAFPAYPTGTSWRLFGTNTVEF